MQTIERSLPTYASLSMTCHSLAGGTGRWQPETRVTLLGLPAQASLGAADMRWSTACPAPIHIISAQHTDMTSLAASSSSSPAALLLAEL